MLDKAQLGPEALQAKAQAQAEVTKIQWALRACCADLSEERQKQFAQDIETAMKSAAAQVPLSPACAPFHILSQSQSLSEVHRDLGNIMCS